MEENNKKLLISIIVPVYNVEKYLRQCLDSVLAQTYQNIEVILVDDGSKDSSGAICEEYAQAYDNILVIHKENAGLGMARNTGLEHATGEYVTFLDSDDWIEPDMVEQLYAGLVNNHVDMCKSGFRRVTDQKEIRFSRGYENVCFPAEKARLELLPRMIGSSPTEHDSIEMCVCASIYRMSIIRDRKLRFPSERVLISEDLVFNIDFMQYASGACTISYVGYNYRINPNSLSTKYKPDRFRASCYFYGEMKKKLKDLGYDSSTLLRLNRIFFVYVRMSISQEHLSVSRSTVLKSISHIREICKNAVLAGAIAEYPVHLLEWKQALFLRLIKYKCAGLLFCLAQMRFL